VANVPVLAVYLADILADGVEDTAQIRIILLHSDFGLAGRRSWSSDYHRHRPLILALFTKGVELDRPIHPDTSARLIRVPKQPQITTESSKPSAAEA
jgi:hypothetical protein